MTHTQDEYFCWIVSSLFGEVRLQHHKGIVEAVDDGRFTWANGKPLTEVLEWVKLKEAVKPDHIDLVRRDQERQIMWEVEKRKIMEALEREWADKTNRDVN